MRGATWPSPPFEGGASPAVTLNSITIPAESPQRPTRPLRAFLYVAKECISQKSTAFWKKASYLFAIVTLWQISFLSPFFSPAQNDSNLYLGTTCPKVTRCRGPPPTFQSVQSNIKNRKVGVQMTFINLRDFYPWYLQDQIVQVSNEVYEELLAGRRSERAHQRKVTRHRAQYSLDCNDGIETSIIVPGEPSPQELMERKERFILLWNALNSLPEVQGRRIDACIIMGRSYRAQARLEGVSKEAIRLSVLCGLATMKRKLRGCR